MTVAALYVDADGPYGDLPDVDVWDIARDARRYKGPHPVVCHPPCQRWGRYAQGKLQGHNFLVGDDAGCFAHALWAVRTFGGVLEHPASSRAWPWFGLVTPGRAGWRYSDEYGYVCSVEQGHYGHPAPKPTWLYVCRMRRLPELVWGTSCVEGRTENLSRRQRRQTPPAFRDLLLSLAKGCYPDSGTSSKYPGFTSNA